MSSYSIEIHTKCSKMMKRSRRNMQIPCGKGDRKLLVFCNLRRRFPDISCSQFRAPTSGAQSLNVWQLSGWQYIHALTYNTPDMHVHVYCTVNSKCPNTFLRFLKYIFTGLNNALHVRNIHFNYFLLFKSRKTPSASNHTRRSDISVLPLTCTTVPFLIMFLY